MHLSEMALMLLVLQVFGSGGGRSAEAAFSFSSPSKNTIASKSIVAGGPIVSLARSRGLRSSLPLKNSLDDIEGLRRSETEAAAAAAAAAQAKDEPTRSNVEQISEVLASAEPTTIGADKARLATEVKDTARSVQSKQEQLDRLKAQRDEILREYSGPVAAAWLTPLAALGAGRAYLQRREAVQNEIESAKAELEAKRAELQRKEAQLGRMPRSLGAKKQKNEGKLRVSSITLSGFLSILLSFLMY